MRVLDFIVDLAITTVALWAVTALVPGIAIVPPEGVMVSNGSNGHAWTFVGVAAVFLVVNSVVGPILRAIGLPLTCLTFGLFAFVINAGVFMLTGWVANLLGLGLVIQSFWAALFGAAVLALVRGALGMLTGTLRQ